MATKGKSFRKRGDGNAAEEDLPDSAHPKQKQKPKQQQLLSFADEDEEDSGTHKKKPGSNKGRPPRSLLSFEGEEGDANGGLKAKKKSYGASHGSGHKMGLGNKEKPQAISVYNQAGEYTPEKLQELHKKTIRVGGVKPQPPPPPAEGKSDEPVVILKGVIKPAASVVETQEDEKIALPAEVLEDEMEYEGAGGIPDAAAIAAAKAQRERKRIAQTAPDYISLETTTTEFRSRNLDEPLKSKKDEALSSDDEAEPRGRLTFIGGKPANGSGVFQFAESVEEEDGEEIWEEAQLKKGVGKLAEDPRVVVASVPALPSVFAQPVPGMMEILSVDREAEAVMASLEEGLKRLQESQGKTKSQLYAVEENLNASEESIKFMDERLSSTKKKYEYMQQLKEYIASLCDFLQEKSSLIEQLEAHMLKLHEDRASAVFERRLLDLSDEKEEVHAAMAAAQPQAQAAIAAVSSIDLSPELDEFGRDINLQRRQEKKMRAEARSRRRARGKSSGGEAQSDESESEETAFESGWDDILETAEKIFSDAAEEFSELEMVKNRLKDWNRDYPAAYRDAFVKVCAPAIFAPFVRVELLRWDPLRESIPFQEMRWYSLLADYDDDPELIPSLIERIALPFLSHNLEHCWDRLSRRGTMNAVAAVMEVLAYVPPSSQASQELMTLVKLQLVRAVSETEVPTWSSQVLASVPQAAEVSANRFECSTKLLRNIGLWENILPKPVLDQVGLDDLLYARIIPHLRVLPPADAIPRAARVVEALQGAWIRAEAKDISPKLGGFVQHLAGLGRALQAKRGSPDVLGLANELRKMLLELRENERAAELENVFQLNK